MNMTRISIRLLTLAATIALSGALGTASAQQQIYGSQLMTQQERDEYQARMRNAQTEQERERLRLEHHQQMQERARQRGVTLPDQPPAGKGYGARPGGGMGPGYGPGPGGGGGAGGGGGR